MGIYTEYNGATKTVAAGAQTIAFTPSDLSNSGILAYHLSMNGGAGAVLTTVTRVRVKASGATIWETSMFALRAYIQSVSPFNLAMADADTTFTIPFRLLTGFALERVPNWRTMCQFPNGAQPTVEIVLNGSATVGTMICGWTWTDEPASMYPRLLSSPLNIPAGANSARYNLNLGGEVVGIVTPTIGVDQFRVVLSGRIVHHLTGPTFGGVAAPSHNLLVEHQRMFGGAATVAAAAPDGSPLYVPIQAGIPAAEGLSYLEYFTTAGGATPFPGATVEAAIHELIPAGK